MPNGLEIFSERPMRCFKFQPCGSCLVQAWLWSAQDSNEDAKICLRPGPTLFAGEGEGCKTAGVIMLT